MPAKCLVLGLDAAEASLLGRLPAFADMAAGGAAGRLVGLHDTLIDTVWPEINTGVSAVHTGHYNPDFQFLAGEKRLRPLRSDELAPERFFWNIAARAGRSAAAIDVPHGYPSPHQPALQILGWGTHRQWKLRWEGSPDPSPILQRSGNHPLPIACSSVYDGTRRGRKRLLDSLLTGLERKVALLSDLMAMRDWDLFVAGISELHCGGHHFISPAGDPGDLNDAEPGSRVVDELNSRLEEGLLHLSALAGEGSTRVVLASHGMGLHPLESHGIVADVLEQMGLTPPNRRRRALAARVPPRLRTGLKRVVPLRLLQSAGLTHDRPVGGGPRAAAVFTEVHGAIRLSIAGRDAGGSIEAGSEEHRKLLADLRSVFLALQHPESGEPVVEAVLELDEELGVDRHPDLPDVVVRFRQDLGLFDRCVSPELGVIQPVARTTYNAQHGRPGGIWLTGPGIEAGRDLGDVGTVDVAPTILQLAGVRLPAWIDGSPLALGG